MRPPQAFVEFGIVEPGTVWRLFRAVYGLRISPKAWGQERDKEMRKMTITIKGVSYHLRQSHIDQSVWSIAPGPPTPQGVSSPADAPAVGWVVVYADDFLITGADHVTNATTETVKDKRKVSEKPTLNYGPNFSVEYLSVNVKATPTASSSPSRTTSTTSWRNGLHRTARP